MTETEYRELQKQFKNKIVLYPTNKEEAYNNGVRSCMSILHSFYNQSTENDPRDWIRVEMDRV